MQQPTGRSHAAQKCAIRTVLASSSGYLSVKSRFIPIATDGLRVVTCVGYCHGAAGPLLTQNHQAHKQLLSLHDFDKQSDSSISGTILT